MVEIKLDFQSKPANGLAMLKALILPRKGFNAAAGLPDIRAHWHDARPDPGALARYCTELGIEDKGVLPITYPHVLVGTMHMNMLAHSAFPIRLLGALHLKNRIVQHRPIQVSERVDIAARFGDCRLVEKGVEFDLLTEIRAAGDLVWQETSIFFVRGRFGGQDNPDPVTSFDLPALDQPAIFHQWHIPANRGRRYAALSGDYNPIHISALAARLFGFERDIAHGFGVLAQALNCIEGNVHSGDTAEVRVMFKGPVFLDSEVSLRQNHDQSTDRFDIYCADNSRPSLCVAIAAA